MGSDYEKAQVKQPQRLVDMYAQYLPQLSQLTAAQSPFMSAESVAAANELVNPSNPAVLAERQLAAAQSRYDEIKAGKIDDKGVKVVNQNQLKDAQKALNIAKQTATTTKGMSTPLGMNALNLQQLQKYALPQAEVGQQVARSNALAGAETNKAQIEGSGGDAARAASSLNRELNPEYDKSISNASNTISDVLGNINLQGLSPGESNAIERSLNQTNTNTGNAGLVNPTNVVSNAMNFGQGYNDKLKMAAGMAGQASDIANVASGNANFSPVSVAMGQPNPTTSSNFGSGQFTNVNPSSSAASQSNAMGFGNNLIGNLFSSNNAAQSAGASMANATSPASYLGAVCCFIFLEAYHGEIPKCVRKGRDKYYRVNHDIATGYRRMAKWLVPAMNKHWLARVIIWSIMIRPITVFLTKPTHGTNKRITHFWLRLWAILGRNKYESSYAMSWPYKHKEIRYV